MSSTEFHEISSHSNEESNPTHSVQVKSGMVGSKTRTLQVAADQNKLYVYKDGKKEKSKSRGKEYQLDEIQCRRSPQKPHMLTLETKQGKKIELHSQETSKIEQNIENAKTLSQMNKFQEQPISCKPRTVNYNTPAQQGMTAQNIYIEKLINPTQQKGIKQEATSLNSGSPEKKYKRSQWYLNPQDWKADSKKGSLIFVNEAKKKNQSKIVKFVVKKFVTTGSFMGISFPVFAMKPETILESYAKAIGAAPVLFTSSCKTPVERIKRFVCLLQSFSILFADMDKPFNPTLGETYQAKIQEGQFSAEQTCHHPPVSSFYYSHPNGYKIYGSMEMTASIGANSATGRFNGDITMEFDEGTYFIKGRLPEGEFSGFMVGENKFETMGAAYVYDNKNNVCSFAANKKNNMFEGCLGVLKPKLQDEFKINVKKPSRFEKFPFYKAESFSQIYDSMQMVYNSHVSFSGKEYFSIHSEKYLPFEPEQGRINPTTLLQSDSRFRTDVPLRKALAMEQSQKEKESIEEQEREFRRLRQKYQKQEAKGKKK